MVSRDSAARCSAVILTASCGLLIASCGGEPIFAKRYPVSGKVTYNGQPLEKGSISFVPEKGASATGSIEHGDYALSTEGNNDGALPGKYKVTIMAKEDPTEVAKAKFMKESKGKGSDTVVIPRQFMAAAMSEAKSLIPVGYGDIRTTTLSAEVKEQSDNTLDFKISDADAPPEPPRANVKGKRR